MNMSKPPWLRVKPPSTEDTQRVRGLVRAKSLNTVCEKARCPNLAECWGNGTATFLVLGDACTRNCGFCAVGAPRAPGTPPAPRGFSHEARRVAEAVSSMGLKHAVITSVTRDDLPDGGASVFAEVVRRIRALAPGCTLEVLVPDFLGREASVATVLREAPEVFGHNMETVRRLYPAVRPQALYRRSLSVLEMAKRLDSSVMTKSGFMVGLGEHRDELMEVMEDLRAVQCDLLTIGQYLRPSAQGLPVIRYYDPREFQDLEDIALRLGFRGVRAGPLVRSSYHAEDQASALGRKKHDRSR